MNKLVYAALASGAMILASGSAFASDGTVTFNGALTAQTCTINGNGSSSKDFTVTLPTVSTGAFSAGQPRAGATSYNIALTNCAPVSATSKAAVFYEAGATVDPTDGRLMVASGGAQNVKLELSNANDATGEYIKAGYSRDLQNSKPADISSGSATLFYRVQYFATSAPTAGAANSSVTYVIDYQ
ncbi:ferrous iron transporter B [Burkholderia sp. SFA1]|uniref:fimbrial protein n=1 Tax=unclassified Caballeronia TaxID=2646786 RepID=UPI001F394DA5|nr:MULTISPECIES: fimbrial protein [unclassified Caballeronia]MCE4544695.1 type 1 fimbrial protein [Caballeronia sp. PC1]MCE4571846.1 type 1 fimbrial protein [Caballeronia sp. CLC5]BBP98294.1 ferrous iron transporter B [Burkholderia sp. SFA1]